MRYSRLDPPHSIVVQHLLERLDEYGRYGWSSEDAEHLLVIADEVGEEARHRSDLALYRKHGT
jgi:hypothetical protein